VTEPLLPNRRSENRLNFRRRRPWGRLLAAVSGQCAGNGASSSVPERVDECYAGRLGRKLESWERFAEGSSEKVDTMRELCLADAPNRFRRQGSREDRFSLQVPEVRANAYENAQVRRINADPSSTSRSEGIVLLVDGVAAGNRSHSNRASSLSRTIESVLMTHPVRTCPSEKLTKRENFGVSRFASPTSERWREKCREYRVVAEVPSTSRPRSLCQVLQSCSAAANRSA